MLQRLSWRDPSGFIIRDNERIFRAVARNEAPQLKRLLESAWFQQRVSTGVFPRSEWQERGPEGFAEADQFAWLEHSVLRFPCYPHEITAAQLHDAATLTLAIAREALSHDWVLKDASAWNVLFDNGRPQFCDVLSFAPRDDSGVWLAHAQFCRHFVIPLLLHKELGIQPHGLFLLHRDGVTPEMARPMLKGYRAYKQPALEAVTLPAMFTKRGQDSVNAAAKSGPARRDPQLARHLLDRALKRLERHIIALKPAESGPQTTWADFERSRNHYSQADLDQKQAFVRDALGDASIETVLDLGCNTGEYAKLAASLGKRVVASDFDHGALTRLHADLRRNPADISPVLFNLGSPTPAVGWMNREVPSFIERAKGRFDCVMVLGLMHHLLVTERAPLPMILEMMQALDTKMLIVEWVEPRDPRFEEIAGFNRALYAELSAERLEAVFSTTYRLVRKCPLPMGSRTLYLWKRL